MIELTLTQLLILYFAISLSNVVILLIARKKEVRSIERESLPKRLTDRLKAVVAQPQDDITNDDMVDEYADASMLYGKDEVK